MGLQDFLVYAKAGLADLQSHPKIHIVIGNESCDLDSTVSAVTYAYFLHQTRSRADTLYLPLLNIPREKFRLRLEVIYFLNKHSIEADHLIFQDDLDLVSLTKNEDITLTVTLVDHHDLNEAERCLRDFVVEVLDHRPQSGVLPQSWNPKIERVGSCCTLVARKLLASQDFTLDSTVAELLLGTILMDTGNMSVSDNVGTPTDREVLVELQSYLPPDASSSIYEGIRNAKSDLSSLTVLEMLYKDLKVLKGTQITVAMASITVRLEDVLSRPEFSHDCAEFCSTLPADVLIIMTLWKDETGLSHRNIAVFSLNRIYKEQVTDVLLNSVSPNLDLELMTSFGHMENVSTFVQKNIQVFRKGVIPLIREFLAGENTSPDENLNALDNLLQNLSDPELGSGFPGEIEDTLEEEARRHINQAKAFQSDQFRTSEDRYDLAAVGMDPVISPSLSSDSELSSADSRRQGEDLEKSDTNDIEKEDSVIDKERSELTGAYVAVKTYGATYGNESGAGDGDNIDVLIENKEASAPIDGAFVDNLIEFGFESNDVSKLPAERSPQTNINSDFTDLLAGDGDNLLFLNNKVDIPKVSEVPDAGNIVSLSDFDVEVTDSKEETLAGLVTISSDNLTVNSVKIDAKDENHLGGDVLQEPSSFSLLYPNIESPMDFSSKPTTNQNSGPGSKIPSYPGTPPNSCMEPSNVVFNKETQLPSFNSSEMVKRIQEKKAALAGHSDKQQKSEIFDDEESFEGLNVGSENSSGGGGSLISPAVPQNSYVDLVSGFNFHSSGNQLPKLMNSDIMERVNDKRSQFEWSIESLEGSTSGVDVGPNSEEGAVKSPFFAEGVRAVHIPVNVGFDPQIPYTPQNSYVEDNFDTYARTNLPSLNNAEIVAKIKAKQSAMFGSGNSSRVSRSSHGSDDSGGCRSPDVVDKSPRGTSLDSPQAPYTPQNSYRDNLGVLESRNHLPDLNEVAERLTTENALKRQFGKRSTSNSGGGSRDEENINLNIHQQSHRRYGRNSSSQSDSQNTMSDVESLMSVSTDVGTPSENIVATGIASQMRNEIAMLSRKDTSDSDVFPSNKTEEFVSSGREFAQPKVSHIDLGTSENMTNSNVAGTNPDKAEEDGSDGVVRNGYAGAKELFSPFDNNKVTSIEDHALFEAAESIVAQSVAAALETTHRDAETGGGRRESRLRWNDNVESDSNDNHSDNEHSGNIYVDDNDDSDNDDYTTEDISEGLRDSDEENVEGNNGHVADNVIPQNDVEEVAATPVIGPSLNSFPEQQLWHHLLDQREESSDDNKSIPPDQENTNHVPQNELQLSSDSLPGTSDLSHPVGATVSLGEQNLADLALNELAFELANELIQSVLDDFPFSHDLTDATNNRAEGEAIEVEQEVDVGKAGFQEIELENKFALDADSMNEAVLNVSGNNKNEASSMKIPRVHDDSDFDLTDSTVPRSVEEILSSSPSSTSEKDFKNTWTILESKKYSEFSLDSNSSSSSSERKRSRDTDSSMTIMENEIMTTFPERKASAEFTALEEEEEEIIQSFPGRKFSKSEDYPNRRFSRDENSSRRSSRLEDSDFEVTIGPEDIETDYLPNMDPLQGNLDIIDSSFSKITDADREVVEGESFRKASGEDFLSGSDEEDRDDESIDGSETSFREDTSQIEGYRSLGFDGTYIRTVDSLVPRDDSGIVEGNIAEEREFQSTDLQFADISNELDMQAADKSNEMGTFADISSKHEIQATNDSSELGIQEKNIFNQIETQGAYKSDEIRAQVIDISSDELIQDTSISQKEEMQDADIFTGTKIYTSDNTENSGELDTEVAEAPNELQTEAGETSSELEIQATETFNELEIQDADTSNELEEWAGLTSSELEHAAGTSNEMKEWAAETFNELETHATETSNDLKTRATETSNELEIQAAENSSELQIQATETSSELETQATETSIELEQAAGTSSEMEEWTAETFNELETEAVETSSDLEQAAETSSEMEEWAGITSKELEQAAGTSTEMEKWAAETFNEFKTRPTETFSELETQPTETFNELETQATETSNELEQAAGTFNEMEEWAAETFNELEIQPTETFNELETQPTETFNELKTQAIETSNDIEEAAETSNELEQAAGTSYEMEEWAAETFNELKTQAIETSNDIEEAAEMSNELEQAAGTSNEMEEWAAETFNELETQPTETFNELKTQAIETSNDIEEAAETTNELEQAAGTSYEMEEWAAETFNEFETQTTETSSELEPAAGVSNEMEERAETSDELDSQGVEISSELEIQATKTFNELEIQATDTSNELEEWAGVTSIELEQAAGTSNEMEEWTAETFNELETEAVETSSDLEQVAETSSEMEEWAGVTSKELEQAAGTSTEMEKWAAETFNEFKTRPTETFSELETQPTETFNELETQATETSNELEQAAGTSNEMEEWAAETFNELETQPTETFNELKTQAIETSNDLEEAAEMSNELEQAAGTSYEMEEWAAETFNEFETQTTETSSELEPAAGVSNEIEERAETSDELDSQGVEISSELEIQATKTFNELEIQATDTSNELEEWAGITSSELEQAAGTSNEMEEWAAEMFNELETQPAETFNELETHATETSNELKTRATETSIELEIQAAENSSELQIQATETSSELQIQVTETSSELEQAAGTSNEMEEWAAETFNELQTEAVETSSDLEQAAETSSEMEEWVGVTSKELEQAAGTSTEMEEWAAETETFNELETQPTETFNELDTQPTETFNELETHATETSNELEQVAGTSTEMEEWAAETFNELETQPTETFNELKTQAIETSNDLEEAAETTNELEQAAGTSYEMEEWAAETFNEFETQETSSELEPAAGVSNACSAAETFSYQDVLAAETSDELDSQGVKISSELDIQALDISTKPNIAIFDERIEQEEASIVEVKKPKQKKKIRVSFSEDFDDEIGDFNITSSSRSSLKSPPPPPSSEDSESPAPSPPPENFTAADEDEVSPLSAAPTQWVPYEDLQRKEVYHTSAGRISIATGDEYDSSGLAHDSRVSPHLSSLPDQTVEEERAQVGEIIESAVVAMSEADHHFSVFDVTTTSSGTVFDSSDAFQAMQSPKVIALTSEHESNNAFSFAPSKSDVVTSDFVNSELIAVNSSLLNDASMKSVEDNRDRHSDFVTSESYGATSHPVTFGQHEQIPATLTVSQLEPVTSDPFNSLPTHVRNLSGASVGSVQGAVYSEEWQDDEIVEVAAQSSLEGSPDDPLRKKVGPDSNFAEAVATDNDIDVEENENKVEEDEDSDVGDLEWENDTPVKTPTRPGIEPTLTGQPSSSQAGQRWKRVSVSGSDFDIDMQAVEPFKNVLSHGGYYDEGLSAIIVFYGCNLPSRRREDYPYIMNHLFHYVIHTLEELVADDYVIIYFHGSTPRRQMPSLAWLKRCYQSIDRRLKKNLKGLFLVHPTLWLRTVVVMLKPFISAKFSSKLRFVRTLEQLNALVPLNSVSIPEAIVHYDIHHQHLPSPPASPHHTSSS